jgi:predicted RNase H-related nuclease YkuK (DUF458 family)
MFNLLVAMADSYSPRSDVVLVQKQARFIILHQGDTGSDLGATLALTGGFQNLKALIIVKESGADSSLFENDARVSWNDVMYRFRRWCATVEGRVWWGSRMHDLRFICMDKAEMSKEVITTIDAETTINELIDYRTFSTHWDCWRKTVQSSISLMNKATHDWFYIPWGLNAQRIVWKNLDTKGCWAGSIASGIPSDKLWFEDQVREESIN